MAYGKPFNIDILLNKLYNLVKSYEKKQVVLKTDSKRAAGGVIAAIMLKMNGSLRSFDEDSS